jgi:hypothetical protein
VQLPPGTGSLHPVSEAFQHPRLLATVMSVLGYTSSAVSALKTCVPLFVLAIACFAQSASPSFDEEHSSGIEQNPPGVTFTISIIPEHSTHHLSDDIWFEVMFTSTKARLYTAELAGAGTGSGSAAGVSFDFVIQGPGMAAPIHSQPSNAMGYACCGSKRRYLGSKPLTGRGIPVSLKRIERFSNEATFPLVSLYGVLCESEKTNCSSDVDFSLRRFSSPSRDSGIGSPASAARLTRAEARAGEAPAPTAPTRALTCN